MCLKRHSNARAMIFVLQPKPTGISSGVLSRRIGRLVIEYYPHAIGFTVIVTAEGKYRFGNFEQSLIYTPLAGNGRADHKGKEPRASLLAPAPVANRHTLGRSPGTRPARRCSARSTAELTARGIKTKSRYSTGKKRRVASCTVLVGILKQKKREKYRMHTA